MKKMMQPEFDIIKFAGDIITASVEGSKYDFSKNEIVEGANETQEFNGIEWSFNQ